MDSGVSIGEDGDKSSSTLATREALAVLWARVLEIDHVDSDEDFILLGGDSLSAVTLFAEIEATFGVALPADAIYDDAATLADMAALIDSQTNGPGANSLRPTGAGGARKSLPSAPSKFTSIVDKRDLSALVKLVALAPLAFVPGQATRTSLCRLLASSLITLRRSRSEYLKEVLPRLEKPISEKELERGILTSVYETFVETWRAYLPWDHPRKARLRGGEHIDAARTAGRGVVLWNCSAGLASRAGLRCIADTDLSILHTWSYDHPFSPSWFARIVLNPIFNRIDDRHIRAKAIVHEGNTIEVMRALGDHLDTGGAVRMPSNSAFSNPYEIPLLGGTYYLGLGAPMLALLHNAALIPTFCLPDGDGGYDLIIEPPLNDGTEPASIEAARDLARRYTAMLEGYIRREPLIWRSWYLPITWQPGGPRGIDDG